MESTGLFDWSVIQSRTFGSTTASLFHVLVNIDYKLLHGYLFSSSRPRCYQLVMMMEEGDHDSEDEEDDDVHDDQNDDIGADIERALGMNIEELTAVMQGMTVPSSKPPKAPPTTAATTGLVPPLAERQRLYVASPCCALSPHPSTLECP